MRNPLGPLPRLMVIAMLQWAVFVAACLKLPGNRELPQFAGWALGANIASWTLSQLELASVMMAVSVSDRAWGFLGNQTE